MQISAGNEELIRSCRLLIANLTPFRGPSADVGTAYEIGFARALKLPVYAYSNVAGNLLELRGTHGPVIALSAAALRSLGNGARRTLERHGELVTADVATIERIGGGSVRCMLAEVALPAAG